MLHFRFTTRPYLHVFSKCLHSTCLICDSRMISIGQFIVVVKTYDWVKDWNEDREAP